MPTSAASPQTDLKALLLQLQNFYSQHYLYKNLRIRRLWLFECTFLCVNVPLSGIFLTQAARNQWIFPYVFILFQAIYCLAISKKASLFIKVLFISIFQQLNIWANFLSDFRFLCSFIMWICSSKFKIILLAVIVKMLLEQSYTGRTAKASEHTL